MFTQAPHIRYSGSRDAGGGSGLQNDAALIPGNNLPDLPDELYGKRADRAPDSIATSTEAA